MNDTIFANNIAQAAEMPIPVDEVKSLEQQLLSDAIQKNTSRDNSALSLSRNGDLTGLKQLRATGQLPARIERCRLAMYAAAKAGHSAVVDWWLNESGVKFNKRSKEAVAASVRSLDKTERRSGTPTSAIEKEAATPVQAASDVSQTDAAWLKRLQTQCSSIARGCGSESEALSFTNGFYLGVISNMRRSRARK